MAIPERPLLHLPCADAMQVVGPSGLEDQQVVACDASRYFSVAVTSTGQVWAFGACYNGSLGSDSSWSTSAQVRTARGCP